MYSCVLIMSTGFVAVVVTSPASIDAKKWVATPSLSPVHRRTRCLTSSYVAHCDAVSTAERVMLMALPRHSPATPFSLTTARRT